MANSTPNVLANDPRFSALARLSERLNTLDTSALLIYLVDSVSPQALPHLAEQFHVMGLEGWPAAKNIEAQRSLIKSAIELHRHKGTPWAMKQVLRSVGYADAVIEEGLPPLRYDGATSYSAEEKYSNGSRWAVFRVLVDIGENKGVGGEELSQLLGMIESVKPARAVLRDVSYRATVEDAVSMTEQQNIAIQSHLNDVFPAGRRYDGSIRHNQRPALARVQQQFNGSQSHGGKINYDGWAPMEWATNGERYNNASDECSVVANAHIDDSQQSLGRCDGRASFEGAMTYGTQPCALDRLDLTITRRRRHNGRFTYNGKLQHQGAATEIHSS